MSVVGIRVPTSRLNREMKNMECPNPCKLGRKTHCQGFLLMAKD